jgi:hypothetical protein
MLRRDAEKAARARSRRKATELRCPITLGVRPREEFLNGRRPLFVWPHVMSLRSTFPLFRSPRRAPEGRGAGARSARRAADRTKGALVHVGCFSASNPSRFMSRRMSQAIGLSRILSRMVSRSHRAKMAIPVRADSAETRSRRGSERGRKDRSNGNWDERGASDLGSGRTPVRTIEAV